jgi:hypothetical protein
LIYDSPETIPTFHPAVNASHIDFSAPAVSFFPTGNFTPWFRNANDYSAKSVDSVIFYM